jgi:hypothetical protein
MCQAYEVRCTLEQIAIPQPLVSWLFISYTTKDVAGQSPAFRGQCRLKILNHTFSFRYDQSRHQLIEFSLLARSPAGGIFRIGSRDLEMPRSLDDMRLRHASLSIPSSSGDFDIQLAFQLFPASDDGPALHALTDRNSVIVWYLNLLSKLKPELASRSDGLALFHRDD